MFMIIPGMLFHDITNLKDYEVVILEELMNEYSIHRQNYNRDCLHEYERYLKSKSIRVTYYSDPDKFYSKIRKQSHNSYMRDYVCDIHLNSESLHDTHLKSKSGSYYTNPDDTHPKSKFDSYQIYSYDPLNRNLYDKWSHYNVKYLRPLNFLLTYEDINNNDFKRLTSCYNFVLRKIGHKPMKSLDKMNRSKLDYEPQETTYKFPTNHNEAYSHLKQFLKFKLNKFGPNQDAIEPQWKYLSHSLLSTPINMGLLCPSVIVVQLMKLINDNKINENSYEGFLRQICGWREYMYFLFVKHNKEITKCNSWNNRIRTIPQEWYNGKTSHPVFNHELEKSLIDSYAHHIPRLMVFLCLLTLYGFHPESIIDWFNSNISMDAYDWVMVTNVYCMGYFCKNYTSRHYLCSSQYITRMSHGYKRDKLWDEKYRTKLKS